MTQRLLMLAMAAGFVATAADWPHYMGPSRNHMSAEKDLIKSFSPAPKVVWRGSVGRGYSGFAIADGLAYTIGHDGKEQEIVTCFDARTGKVAWKHAYKADLMPKYHKGGPNATPTVANGVVYTISKDGQMFALNAKTGKVAWKKDVGEVFGIKEMPVWGYACSPVMVDGVMWLYANGPAAVDPKSGEVLWKDPDGGKAGYSTAAVFKRGDKSYVAGMTGTHLRIHDVATKKEVAKYEFKVRYDVNAMTPMPLDEGNTILIGNGYDNGRTISLAFSGNSLKENWFQRDLKLMMNNPVIVGDYIYGVDGNNNKVKRTRFVCASLKDGKIQWDQKGYGCGSMVYADGNLYVLSEFGELMVAPASPEGFLNRGRAKIFDTGVCWTAPALANGHIYLRNDAGDVACIALTK